MSIDLNITWFILVGVLLAGYAILDGFDFGVGILHLFVKKDEDRRMFINSIGPVWDGNEVWLVTGGGALFAAFPEAYATIFSGMYLAILLLLLSLIFRAVAIEFRSKLPQRAWRQAWDVSFSLASMFSSVIFGIAVGNLILGLPMNERHEYTGTFLDLFNPYSLLIGVTMLALFSMHGAIYLVLKLDGELHERVRGWVNSTIIFFIICYGIATMATLMYVPRMAENLKAHPVLFGVPLLTMLAIANIPRQIHRKRDFRAFLSSCAGVAGLMSLFAAGTYPYIVYNPAGGVGGLDIHNAASSHRTLQIMLVIAAIGVPVVLAYTASIYYVFRGKVRLDATSY